MTRDRITVPEALGRILLTTDSGEMRVACMAAYATGATMTEVDHVRGLWERRNGPSEPSPNVCRCSHHRRRHNAIGSVCFATVCGCNEFRPSA